MGQVKAESAVIVPADQDTVLATLADYKEARPAILTGHYLDYHVVEGGTGTGTVAEWTLQATAKRSRAIKATVTVDNNTISEKDANSSLLTVWQVTPAGSNTSRVSVTTTWKGAGGIGGFFEGIFAPLGLKKIHNEVLSNLALRLATSS